MILKNLAGLQDLKKLESSALHELAQEIREAMLFRLSRVPGHFGPNFGFVEAQIALHYVFNSPIDKFVFDVSHQSYPHKILTGRSFGFLDQTKFNEVSGYSDPHESDHDFFIIGHTSTSISLAAGLAKGRDLQHRKENIVAIIGDGSLSGGEAYEALNYAGSECKSNLIILLNDNQQSIAENHGGIYQNLALLRKTQGKAENNLFKAMNLDYCYEEQGNNIEKLITLFQSVKDIDHPIVVHINTQKGKGHHLAEIDLENWHYSFPTMLKGQQDTSSTSNHDTYEEISADLLLAEMQKDERVVLITPAMPSCVGFTLAKRQQAGAQYIDVGIAEEHAVALLSGIAANGGKPVLATNATFIQRAYDQISQDLCINQNAGTILINYSSLWGLNDVTHLGFFTLAAFSNIPNLILLAPTNKAEYCAMLTYAINQVQHPMMVIIPGNGVIEDQRVAATSYADIHKFKVEQVGKRVAIIALGAFYQLGETISKTLKNKFNIQPTLINPRFASGIDEELLADLAKEHELTITLEDGILEGGFGYKIASFYGCSPMKVKNYGLKKAFVDRYDAKELLIENRLHEDLILEDIAPILHLK